MEVIFGILTKFREPPDSTYLIVGMLAIIFFLILIVTFMAIFRPESLKGIRIDNSQSSIQPSESKLSYEKIENPDIFCAATTVLETFKPQQQIQVQMK